MTEGNLENIDKSMNFTEEKEPTEAEKNRMEIEELKRKNLEAMYPEYYNNSTLVQEDSDNEEKEEPEQQIENTDQSKLVLNSDLMKRAARKQIQDTRKDTAYIEGNYDYNIWYDKYLTDQRQEEERVTSMHKVDPIEDTGYTKADKYENPTYFCTYFVKGCCAEGTN